MDRSDRLEAAANISVICAAVLMCSLLAWMFLSPYFNKPNAVQKPPVGKVLKVSQVDWQQSDKTLVLVLSTQCHFCSESAPFYQKLLGAAKAKKVRTLVVVPQTKDEGLSYLTRLNIAADEVEQSPLGTIFVAGTPTLLIVDRTGTVKAGWIGKLAEAGEHEVVNSL